MSQALPSLHVSAYNTRHWTSHIIRSKRAIQCHKCHACHAKRRWISPSATPATQSAATKVNVSLCHACHAKCCGVICDQSGPSATQCHKCHACHAKRRWMSPSATPATQNEGECLRVPRLPRKVPRRHPRLIRSKRATQCHKCHACHAKRRWMSPSATPATQSAATDGLRNMYVKDRGWQRWLTKMVDTDGLTEMYATDGLTNMYVKDGGWQRWLTQMVWQRCMWKMVVDMYVKDGGWQRWLKYVCERWWLTKMVDKYVCEGWWLTKIVEICMWKMVVDKDGWQKDGGWWLTKMVDKDGGHRWFDKDVCERWWLTQMVWQRLVVRLLVWQRLVVRLLVVCVGRRRREAGGGAGGTRDTESKTRTPHKVVGNYLDFGSRVDGAGKIMGMINWTAASIQSIAFNCNQHRHRPPFSQ